MTTVKRTYPKDWQSTHAKLNPYPVVSKSRAWLKPLIVRSWALATAALAVIAIMAVFILVDLNDRFIEAAIIEAREAEAVAQYECRAPGDWAQFCKQFARKK